MELGVVQPGVQLDVTPVSPEIDLVQPVSIPVALGAGFIPPSNQVTGVVDGVPTPITLWMGSTAEYDAISPKDPFTLYIVTS